MATRKMLRKRQTRRQLKRLLPLLTRLAMLHQPPLEEESLLLLLLLANLQPTRRRQAPHA
jgi:hypothetical protein